LNQEVSDIFVRKWETRDGVVVPEPEDLGLANDGVYLDATVLYADMSASTDLVDAYPAQFAAEVYKAFLHCAAKVIRAQDGEITAYDGDRIMAVFLGKVKNTAAIHAALSINDCVRNIVNPSMESVYHKGYTLSHKVGIDTSKLLVARTGVRGANDLVWVGRAANYAAKLTGLDSKASTRITKTVYDRCLDEARYAKGENMWYTITNSGPGGLTVYGSNYFWSV